ncbi:hypothetical protein PGTUg99_021277 [Puccinia graminis f. sp. tritici]|uniref:Uncharacterized protein n=1 Tax=Puccinia graminis f. sp. tritici TaxID=56615 RepID=A0A5B0S0H0_PUCGR|nr:hypothetical protein PGTUg99_021277 [Puccinia graminis f. sp. tritici]
MNATIYALLCLAAAAANVATVGEKMKCFTYSAGTKGYSCNDRSDIICTEGCKTFATITNCTLPRDGRLASGYPRGCGYPAAFSGHLSIRIRIRTRGRVSVGRSGYPSGYPRIPAL